MQNQHTTQVTVIYYSDESLELFHEMAYFLKKNDGRVVIPQLFKKGKSIIAVCHGEVQILNKFGDRIISISDVA
jgi:uncharacterized protein (TIGR02922 family)